MPNRIAQEQASSATSYGGLGTSSRLEAKNTMGPSGARSVKKLVRSLSDRYAAVTSPLTCKKKPSCISGNPSLKTMKTTAATSLLPLKPAFSASCKSSKQSVALASSRRKDSITFSKNANTVRSAPSVATSTRLLHMQARPCTEARSTTESTHIVKRSFRAEGDDHAFKAPSLAMGPLHIVNLSGNKKANPAAKQLMDMSLRRDLALPIAHGTELHRPTHPLSQALARSCTKQDWPQLEALLRLKDEEIGSIQTAGLMLKELCMKQDEEIKTLKAAFPATLKEMAELRETCERQEKELVYSRVALPAMQEQVATLTDQLKLLTEDLAQMKSCKETSSEKVSSHFHEREASNSSSSFLSAEPSPVTNGFLSHLRRSRRGLNCGIPCEDQRQMPVKGSDAALSSCSSVTSTDRSCELASENTLATAKHRRGFSAVLSVEHILNGSGKRSSRRLATDNEIVDTLHELDKMADKEQALLKERCANAVRELRSSSSRFASLEPIKSILTCASPQLFQDPPDDEEEVNRSQQRCKQEANTWNLRPT